MRRASSARCCKSGAIKASMTAFDSVGVRVIAGVIPTCFMSYYYTMNMKRDPLSRVPFVFSISKTATPLQEDAGRRILYQSLSELQVRVGLLVRLAAVRSCRDDATRYDDGEDTTSHQDSAKGNPTHDIKTSCRQHLGRCCCLGDRCRCWLRCRS